MGHTVALRAAALTDWLLRYDNDARAAFFAVLCDLSDGMSLERIAEDGGLRYGDLMGWIRLDKDRSRAVDLARLDRDELDRERARWAVSDTLSSEIAEVPTHGERLKAAAMMDPRRYGAQVAVKHDYSVVTDAGLVGTLRELLARRTGRTIDVTPTQPQPPIDTNQTLNLAESADAQEPMTGSGAPLQALERDVAPEAEQAPPPAVTAAPAPAPSAPLEGERTQGQPVVLASCGLEPGLRSPPVRVRVPL